MDWRIREKMFLYDHEIVKRDMEEIISFPYIPFEKMNHKRVLITGANGMLAYYFTCVLMYLNQQKGMDISVVALVRSKEKALKKFSIFLQNPNFILLHQNICDPISIKLPVHFILHAAGASSPKYIKNEPLEIIKANVQGSFQVLEFARRNPIESILYTSTREIYGKVEGKQWIEESDMGILDPLDSRSCYPESKRMAEQIFKSYHIKYHIPFTIVRIAHSYGPGMDIEQDGRVMSDFISDIVNKRDIILKSDGTAIRAFCYLTDTITAMYMAMLSGKNGEAYNISNETEPYSIRVVAEKLLKLFPELNAKLVTRKETESGLYCNYTRVGLSTKKIELLGWKPIITLEQGLYRTVQSFF